MFNLLKRTSRKLSASTGKFRRSRDGSIAIEFSMLIIPFALVIFTILEACASFAAQQIMANATDDIARQVRTGRYQNATAAGLKTMVCEDLSLMVTSACQDNLVVDLRSYPTYAAAAQVRIRIVGGELDTAGFAVSPGGTGTINMLRVFYKWPVMTDFVRYKTSHLNDGKTILSATAIWQNEPFDAAAAAAQ